MFDELLPRESPVITFLFSKNVTQGKKKQQIQYNDNDLTRLYDEKCLQISYDFCIYKHH